MKTTFALLTLLLGSSAQAQSEMGPYALRLTQNLAWQDNLFRTADATAQSDWLSTTGINGSVDEQLGRQRLKADATVGLNRYRSNDQLNNTSYSVGSTFIWTAPDLMAGELGALATARRSVYGDDSEAALGPEDTLNIERTQRLFAKARVGGPSAWTFGAGVDSQRRRYSEPAFDNREVRQVTASLDARYRASPDLSLGTALHLTDGKFPQFDAQGADNFRTKVMDLSTDWQATGASRLSLTLGRSSETHDRQADRSFWTGAAQWNWAPTGRLTVQTGLRRDNSANQVGSLAASNLSQQSLNTRLDAAVKWAATSKLEFSLGAQRLRRSFDQSIVNSVAVSGVDHTRTVDLGVRYALARSIELSCKLSDERRTADDSLLTGASRAFKARIATCGGSLLLS